VLCDTRGGCCWSRPRPLHVRHLAAPSATVTAAERASVRAAGASSHRASRPWPGDGRVQGRQHHPPPPGALGLSGPDAFPRGTNGGISTGSEEQPTANHVQLGDVCAGVFHRTLRPDRSANCSWLLQRGISHCIPRYRVAYSTRSAPTIAGQIAAPLPVRPLAALPAWSGRQWWRGVEVEMRPTGPTMSIPRWMAPG
jgi:hypothetical protein